MSGGEVFIGWNRSGGKGETTFTSCRDGGWVGGFDFWLNEGDRPIFQIRGDGVTIAGAVVHPSDARGKEEIAPLEKCLDIVRALRGVSYKDAARGTPEVRSRKIGVIAQEVERVLPDLVLKDAQHEGALAVNYTGLIPVLLEALKELGGTVERLEAQVRDLTHRDTGVARISA
jgi:hypothetical protein